MASNIERKVQSFPMYPLSPYIVSLIINIPYQSRAFISTNEPTMIHHNHLKSMVYIMVHSWFCTFYRYTMMGIYLYSKIKNISTGLVSLLNPTIPRNCNLFTVALSIYMFSFCRMSYSWHHTV